MTRPKFTQNVIVPDKKILRLPLKSRKFPASAKSAISGPGPLILSLKSAIFQSRICRFWRSKIRYFSDQHMAELLGACRNPKQSMNSVATVPITTRTFWNFYPNHTATCSPSSQYITIILCLSQPSHHLQNPCNA